MTKDDRPTRPQLTESGLFSQQERLEANQAALSQPSGIVRIGDRDAATGLHAAYTSSGVSVGQKIFNTSVERGIRVRGIESAGLYSLDYRNTRLTTEQIEIITGIFYLLSRFFGENQYDRPNEGKIWQPGNYAIAEAAYTLLDNTGNLQAITSQNVRLSDLLEFKGVWIASCLGLPFAEVSGNQIPIPFVRSTDQGRSWQVSTVDRSEWIYYFDPAAASSEAKDIAYFRMAKNEDALLAQSLITVARSIDGVTWQTVEIASNDQRYACMACGNNYFLIGLFAATIVYGHIVQFGAEYTAIKKSIDDGSTWESVYINPPVDPFNSGYIGGVALSSPLPRSIDYCLWTGREWVGLGRKVIAFRRELILGGAIRSVETQIFLLWRSIDGETWIFQDDPLPIEGEGSIGYLREDWIRFRSPVAMINDGRKIVLMLNNGRLFYCNLTTIDRWNKIPSPFAALESYQEIGIVPGYALAYDSDSGSWLAASPEGRFSSSVDGLRWSPLFDPRGLEDFEAVDRILGFNQVVGG